MGRAGENKVFELPDVARAGFSDIQLDEPSLTPALEARLGRAFASILNFEKSSVPSALDLLSRHRFLLEPPRHLCVDTLLIALADTVVGDGSGSLVEGAANRYMATTGAGSESSSLMTFDSSTPTIGWHLRADPDSTSEYPQTVCGLTIHNPPERPNQWTRFGPIHRWVDPEVVPEHKRGQDNACRHCYQATVSAPDEFPLFAGGKPNLTSEEEQWQVKAACTDPIAEAILASPTGVSPKSGILREPVMTAMTEQLAALAAKRLLELEPAERHRRLLGVSSYDSTFHAGQYPQGHSRLREIVEQIDPDYESAEWPDKEKLAQILVRWVPLQVFASDTDRAQRENAFRMAVVAQIWPEAAERMAERILDRKDSTRYAAAMAVIRSEHPEMVERVTEKLAQAEAAALLKERAAAKS